MSRTKPYQVLAALRDCEFHSGQKLADSLGVTRTSIATYVKQLIRHGADIYSVRGRGYRLAEPINLLDETLITKAVAAPVYLVDEIGSTNTWMMSHLDELQQGSLACCEFQSAGRGRRGREWVAPVGGQLAFSLYWQHASGLEAAMGLSLVVGVTIAQVLREHGFSDVGVKWPNDIYAKDKKLGGILVEMSGQADGVIHLVVGVGLNIKLNEQARQRIDQASIDLLSLGDISLSRSELLIEMYQALDKAYQTFTDEGIKPFIQRWPDYDIYLGKSVRLTFANKKIVEGVAGGIDAQGNIILNINGENRSFLAGEVSLRVE